MIIFAKYIKKKVLLNINEIYYEMKERAARRGDWETCERREVDMRDSCFVVNDWMMDDWMMDDWMMNVVQ